MILQPRDIDVLVFLSRYFILNSRQIRELCFPDDTTNRITRRRLTKMMHEGYLRKRNMHVVHPSDGSTSPVYHLAKRGREFLVGHMNDETLHAKPIEPLQPQHLYHYVAVSETHRLFDRSAEKHAAEISIPIWVNEDEYVNPHEEDKSQRFYLRSKFEEHSRVVCLPDAACLLEYKDQRAAIYLEQDRDTYFHDRVAARKSPGYQQLFQYQGHRRHFPNTTHDFFFVLVVTPTKKRAEQLRKAFAKMNKDQDVKKVYRFGSLDELNEQNLFFEPVFSCCHHYDKVPLVKRIK